MRGVGFAVVLAGTAAGCSPSATCESMVGRWHTTPTGATSTFTLNLIDQAPRSDGTRTLAGTVTDDSGSYFSTVALTTAEPHGSFYDRTSCQFLVRVLDPIFNREAFDLFGAYDRAADRLCSPAAPCDGTIYDPTQQRQVTITGTAHR